MNIDFSPVLLYNKNSKKQKERTNGILYWD